MLLQGNSDQPVNIASIMKNIETGMFDEAESHCVHLMEHSDDPELLHLMALICGSKGEYKRSFQFFEKILVQFPNRSDILHNFGVMRQRAGDIDQAVQLWKDSLQFDSLRKDTIYNLGKGLIELRRYKEAEEIFQKALYLDPENAELHYNLGNFRFRLDDFISAEKHLREAIRISSEWAEPWINLGMTLKNQLRLEEAEACYRRAIQLKSDSVDAHWNLSHLLFLQERWEEGFFEYEWRLQRPESPTVNWGCPRWDGSYRPASRLLLWAEQGIGDAIQFLRYIIIISEYFDEIVVYCHPSLMPLVKSIPEVKEVYAFGSPIPAVDFHAPLLSLPYICGVADPSHSWKGPYLHADHPLVPAFPEKRKKRVGLVWAGNPEHQNDRNRSCPLSEFLPLFSVQNIDFYSFQVGVAEADLKQWDPEEKHVGRLSSRLVDFSKTAAWISPMDLMISVDTAVAHLSGALGKKIWLLVPYIPDWRWPVSGEQTPWYPDMRIYRQKNPGDWSTVVEDVLKDLSCRL